MIVAIDVATAILSATCAGTPTSPSTRSSAGTMTMPPPTPRSPASSPAATPATASAASAGSHSIAALMGFPRESAGFYR
jgi:hypothetical protein